MSDIPAWPSVLFGIDHSKLACRSFDLEALVAQLLSTVPLVLACDDRSIHTLQVLAQWPKDTEV